MFSRRLPLIFATLSLACFCEAQAQRVRQEAAFQRREQTGAIDNIPSTAETVGGPSAVEATAGTDDGSFGVQQFLKETQRARYWHAFSQWTVLATNNVALTRRDPQSDQFLIGTAGLEYRRPLGHGWEVESTVQGTLYRFNQFRFLDFNSIDAGVGLNFHTDKWTGWDFFARYNYNVLTTTKSADAFLQNQTITAGVQKVIPFNPANGVYFGLAAQTAFTDPKIQERSEFSAYGGYFVQATRKLEANLLYRYAYIPYTDYNREDHNQTVSLGVRYRFTPWFSVFVSGFAGWNHSNYEVFSYHDLKGGGGLTVDLRF